MASSNLIRLGGLMGIVSGVIFAVNGSLVSPAELGGTLRLRVSTVLFLLSIMALIAALHLLQKDSERYGSGGVLVSATAFVGVALTAGSLIFVDSILFLVGLGTVVFFVGALVATIGISGLATVALMVGALPRWGGVALILGNPLLGVLIILIFYGANFALGSWLVVAPWIVVSFAVFLAAGRRTERPARVR